ncbi:hypothetical protein C8J57DRAFT_1590114 [Mycena rebaudengoi]|nr:hypothetical protein C8J57DRAFT_1590114 [Mycena rebaudengoi]
MARLLRRRGKSSIVRCRIWALLLWRHHWCLNSFHVISRPEPGPSSTLCAFLVDGITGRCHVITPPSHPRCSRTSPSPGSWGLCTPPASLSFYPSACRTHYCTFAVKRERVQLIDIVAFSSASTLRHSPNPDTISIFERRHTAAWGRLVGTSFVLVVLAIFGSSRTIHLRVAIALIFPTSISLFSFLYRMRMLTTFLLAFKIGQRRCESRGWIALTSSSCRNSEAAKRRRDISGVAYSPGAPDAHDALRHAYKNRRSSPGAFDASKSCPPTDGRRGGEAWRALHSTWCRVRDGHHQLYYDGGTGLLWRARCRFSSAFLAALLPSFHPFLPLFCPNTDVLLVGTAP